ncbi:hypothetical protein I4U23_000125 [Adineta vaga]|nr:hypothetical protein I4U23_000125 [Adineta vaga]
MYYYNMSNVNIYAIGSILCLQTLSNCVISTIGQYVYLFYLQIYSLNLNITLNFTNDSFVYNENNADEWAQQQSADLYSKRELWSSIPMIIMTCLLGLYVTKLGRRFVLILPMIGLSIQLFIWLLIIYFQLKTYWWYIAAFILGLTGADGTLHLILNLSITDCTKENNRSTCFVFFEAMTTALTAIGNFIIGYYITWRGFTDLLFFSIILQLLSIFIVIFFFKYSSHHPILDRTNSTLLSSIELYNDIKIKDSCCCCCSKMKLKNCFYGRSKKKSINLLLTIFSYVFYSLAYTAIWSILLWYLFDIPFNWSSTQIGNYNALISISSAILSVLGMKLLTHFGANDAIICVFSHICFFGLAIGFAFARQNWQLYITLLIVPFVDYQSSLTWSMMSKWLKPNEYSTAFTLIAVIYTTCSILGSAFFNWIYELTVIDLPYFTFLLAAGLSLIPLILNICLFVTNQRLSDNILSSSNELDIQLDDSDLIWWEDSLDTNEFQNNSSVLKNNQITNTDDLIIF